MTFCKGRSPRGCSRRVPTAKARTPEMCSKTAEKAAHSVQGNAARKGSEEGTALVLTGKVSTPQQAGVHAVGVVPPGPGNGLRRADFDLWQSWRSRRGEGTSAPANTLYHPDVRHCL